MATIDRQHAEAARQTDDARTRRARHGTARRSRLIAAVVVPLVLAVVALAVYAVSRPAKAWDPASPQGVVQSYVTAVVHGDSVAAAAFLASSSPCAATDVDRAFVPSTVGVDLVGAQVQGDAQTGTALVRVLVRYDQGAQPLANAGEQHTIRLVRSAATGGQWRIDGIPWPLYECTGG